MEVSVQFNFKEADPLDFNTVHEGWLPFTLSDGSKLKVKMTLISVWRSRSQYNPVTGEPLYWWHAPNLVSLVSFPQRFRGEPAKELPNSEAVAQQIDEVVDFEMTGKHDEWNVYNLSDGTVVRLRMNLTSIARTHIHAPTGEPIYSVATGQANARLKVPSGLIKKVPPMKHAKPPSSATYA